MEREEIKKYQRLLIQYFKKSHPEKLKFQPKVIEFRKHKVVFGMMKHMGRCSIKRQI
jgi:hypothetical protein